MSIKLYCAETTDSPEPPCTPGISPTPSSPHITRTAIVLVLSLSIWSRSSVYNELSDSVVARPLKPSRTFNLNITSVGSSHSIPSSINDPSKPASSHSVQVSPCHAALTSGVQPHPVLSTTNKAAKAKHRWEPSPVWLDKWPRGSDNVTSLSSAGKGLPHLLKWSWLNPLLRG